MTALPPETFKKYKFVYELLDLQGSIALYEQSYKGVVVGFEIHKLRLWANRIGKFSHLNRTIRMPSNEDFGKWAWSFNTLDYARKKFNELLGLPAPENSPDNPAQRYY